MLFYSLRRFFYMIIILLMVSVVAFIIIQLPPGDYLTSYIIELRMVGEEVSEAEIASLEKQYGLDLPMHLQYFKWMWGILHGDFGRSFAYKRRVRNVIAERLPLTVMISLFSLVFIYSVAVPIGIYSATHQYSVGDYAFTAIGFAGLATPNFLLALILMFLFYKYFGLSVGGLFSPNYMDAAWNIGKFVDMLRHLPIPIIVIGTAGMAGLIRVMRGCLLDELRKQYVITARAKGVSERILLFKYPVRVAINPIVSTIGWTLPGIVSGATITAIVLGLPIMGPVLFTALIHQDMYLAGSIIMFQCFLTIIGTFISDFLLVLVDPRIKYEKKIERVLKMREREKEVSAKEKYYVASQWQLMWQKFKKHKLAIFGGTILAIFYLLAVFCEFFSPYDIYKRHTKYIYCPPQRIHFFDEKGNFHLRPFVYASKRKIDPVSWHKIYTEDKTKKHPIYFFVQGDKYKFWNLFPTNIHLFGVRKPAVIFLFGTDELGRDLFSRNFYASRISLSIGLVGVFLSFVLGCILGGISGYYGGAADMIIQRVIEFLISIPTIPLWMALSAALPKDWSPIKVYFGIVIILSIVGWCGLARVVRGKLISIREEDFAMAAKIAGASEGRIIARHLLPSFLSYLIVNITLSIPRMILGETALSFLGLGLRPPAVSWGVLLSKAQNVQTVVLHPWLMLPAVFVIITVLAFNFIGDGLRDAADPYK